MTTASEIEAIGEATEATFDQAVLERSRQVPVLVDFWAEWCAPCRTLAPILESAIADREGSVALVKVDTDANPELAARWQIRGIPAVKAFVDGRLVDEFVGVLDRRAVDLFIDRICPSAEDRSLAQARQALAEGRHDEARSLATSLLADPPRADEARLVIAEAAIGAGDLGAARQALEALDGTSPMADAAEAIRWRVELLAAADAVSDPAAEEARLAGDPTAHERRWALAGKALERGDHEQALELLLEQVQHDRKFRDDGARRAMLAVFHHLGDDHALVRHYRRQLQIYL